MNMDETDFLNKVTPPSDKECEQRVIGPMIQFPGVFDEIASVVTADDFYWDAHQKLFKVIAGMHAAGKRIDAALLYVELKRVNQLEDIGGSSYIAELWDLDPTGANAAQHARVVKEFAERRRVLYACMSAVNELRATQRPLEDIVADLDATISKREFTDRSMEIRKLSDLIPEESERIRKAIAGELLEDAPIPTGLELIDKAMGGIRPGITTIGARPGVGKSAFGIQILRNAAKMGVSALIVSMEMSPHEIFNRNVSSEAAVDLKVLMINPYILTVTEQYRIGDAMKSMQDATFFFVDAYNMDLNKFLTVARRAVVKYGVKLIVLDYLQLMGAEKKQSERLGELSHLTRGLKNFQRQHNISLIQLAQFNRNAADSDEPRLSEFRESGTIEQDTDNAILLWPTAEENELTKTVGCNIAKQRNGPTVKGNLIFRKRTTTFENYENRPVDPQPYRNGKP